MVRLRLAADHRMADLASLDPKLTHCLGNALSQVKDLAEADFGRLEIEMAEAECPGLMSCRSVLA